jgi:predicted homoserine dehydrogenase-like protein
VAPKGAPVCDVVAIAKRNLRAGERLDGVGGFCAYGAIENATVSRRDALLPIGLSDGCVLTRDMERDEPISFSDVEVPAGRLADRLRTEQNALFD